MNEVNDPEVGKSVAEGVAADGISSVDSVTVTKTFYSDQILAKTVRSDNAEKKYGRAYWFDLMSIQVSSLDDIGGLLQVLQDKQRCCAVFGGIRDPQRVSRVRRLSKPDGDYMPTIKAVAHRWCSLDIDKGPMPVGGDMKDLAGCSAAMIAKLPPEFHGVRHVVQATAGHARKLGGTRLRLWFWMSRWVTGDELGFWLKKYVSDHCTFRPAQPIYTAAPKFLDCHDLLPYRIKGVNGKPEVQVPDPADLKPKPRPPAPPYVPGRPVAPEDYQAIIDGALARAAAARDGEKHDRLRAEARLLGGIQVQADLSDAEIIQWLLDALPDTVKDRDAAEETARWGLEAGRSQPFNPESKTARKALTATVFKLLRRGIPGAELLKKMFEQNSEFPNPLATESVVELVKWAVNQESSGGFHAG